MTVVVLSGGVGGAKLVRGLAAILPGDQLTAIVNTGDDFTHLGLPISPDIDSVLYALAGKSDPVRGWGREAETWGLMAALTELGGPDWFQLGDRDLALHVFRLHHRNAGEPLSMITARMARAWGIACTVLPMTDDTVSTQVVTDEGLLHFQDYFVRRRCRPVVTGLRFDGAESAKAPPGALHAIRRASVIIIAPSNPWLSIDPILAIPDLAAAVRGACVPVVAVAPLIGNRAIKGPTAKIMSELGMEPSNQNIVRHYGSLLSGILVNSTDKLEEMPLPLAATEILMENETDRERVARSALNFARCLAVDLPPHP